MALGTSYASAHRNVRGKKGSAKLYKCVGCGGRAAHWSYSHSDPDDLFDNDRGATYSMDHRYYRPRCGSCHKAYDTLYQIARNSRTTNLVPKRG